MSRQDKGNLCACRCGERKPNRKRRYLPGHSETNKFRKDIIDLKRRAAPAGWRD